MRSLSYFSALFVLFSLRLATSLLLPSYPITSGTGFNIDKSNETQALIPRAAQYKQLKQLTDSSCGNAADSILNEAWNVSGGDAALDQFVDMYNNNLFYCDACFGQSVCNVSSTGCRHGLRDASNVSNGLAGPRIDIALSQYAGYTTAVICGADGTGCDAVDCGDVNDNAAAYVLVKSIVQLSNFLQASWEGLTEGVTAAEGYSTEFQQTFAPIKQGDISSERTALATILAVINGLVGFLPEVGKVAKDIFGVAVVAISNSEFTNNIQTAPNFQGLIEDVGFRAKNATVDFSKKIFSDGFYGQMNQAGVNLTQMMRNGSLLTIPNIPQDYNGTFMDLYLRTIFQGAALYVWLGQQGGDPFITFAPGRCSDLDYTDAKSVPFAGMGLEKLDVGYDYNGNCYWLLADVTTTQFNSGYDADGPVSSYSCPRSLNVLPGGTNQALSGADWSHLSLGDFIIPSVEGWLLNNKINGYPALGTGHNLVPDPRAPGALNITVCDYMNVRDMAGLNCPLLDRQLDQKVANGNCARQSTMDYPLNAFVTPNWGTYYPGTCKINMTQYLKYDQYNDMDENPDAEQYQLSVTVMDDQNRVIGNAAKAWVGAVWQVWNTALPSEILLHVWDDPDKPIEVWYQDQFWTTDDKSPQFKCVQGGDNADSSGWIQGNRQIGCKFACPAFKEGDPIPPSATNAHIVPPGAIMQPVIPFGPAATNLYPKTNPAPDMKWQTDWRQWVYPDVTRCSIHVTQYQKNADGVTDQYQYEAYLSNEDNKVQFEAGLNAQVPATPGQPMPIYGLEGDFTVTFPSNQDFAMEFNYTQANGKNQGWDSDNQDSDHGCYATGFAMNHRDVYCNFDCS